MPKIYYPGDQYESGEYASALAIGDSWFWYPNNNIIGTLVRHPKILDSHSNVQVVGFNGAHLRDYVGAGKYAKNVDHFLSPGFSHGFSEFYISGAGNDAIQYRLALKQDCTGITDPKACLDIERLDIFCRDMSSALGSLIHNIRWAYRNDPGAKQPIFLNAYDYPVPDGRGFLSGHAWLQPAMNNAKVDQDLNFRRAVVKSLINVLVDEVFAKFHSKENLVILVDSRGTLDHSDESYRKDWTNEMHPTNQGFLKIVDKHWISALKSFGISS